MYRIITVLLIALSLLFAQADLTAQTKKDETKKTTEKNVAETIRTQLFDEKKNQTMTDWAENLAKRSCTSGEIAYQVGYSPNPDPCAQFTSTTSTTTP